MFRCDFGFVRSGDKGSSCIKDKRYLTIGDTGQKQWRKWCYYEISSIDVSCRARGGLSHTWALIFFHARKFSSELRNLSGANIKRAPPKSAGAGFFILSFHKNE